MPSVGNSNVQVKTDFAPPKPKRTTQRSDSTRKTKLTTGGSLNSKNPVDDVTVGGLINNPVDYWTFPAPTLTVGREQFHVYLIPKGRPTVLLDPAVEQLDWEDADGSGGVWTGNLQIRDVEMRPHDFLVKPGDLIALWVRDNDGRFKEWWRMKCVTPGTDYLSGARTFELKNDLHRLIDSQNEFKYVKDKNAKPKGWSGREVFQDICDRYGIPLRCPHLKTVLTDYTPRVVSPAGVLVYVLNKEFKETGVRYLWAYEHGTMVVRPKQRSELMLKLGNLLTQASFSETIATEFATAMEMRSVADKSSPGDSGAEGDGYFQQVLRQMGITPTAASVQFMNAWAHREGVPQSVDNYNLLGTTLPRGGSHGTNAPGVQSYPTVGDGISAHSAMLNQGNFKSIKTALASGDPESYSGDSAVQAEFSSWSGGGYTWPSTGMPVTPVTASGSGADLPSSTLGTKATVKKTKKAVHTTHTLQAGLKVEVRVLSAIDRYGLVTQMGWAYAASRDDLENIAKVHMALMLRADKTITVTHPGVVGLRKFDAVKVQLKVDPKIFSYVLFVKAIQFSLAAGQFDMLLTLQVDDPLVALPDDKVYATLADAQQARQRPVSTKSSVKKKKPPAAPKTPQRSDPQPTPSVGNSSVQVKTDFSK